MGMVAVALLGNSSSVKSPARGLQFLLLRVFVMIFNAFGTFLNSVVVLQCILILRTNVADLSTIVETLLVHVEVI